MTTLREHLEAIRDRHERIDANWKRTLDEAGVPIVCGWCRGKYPCPDYADAVAALAILDDADEEFSYPPPDRIEHCWRLVPDEPQDTNT